ncbi:unnamed protein product [Nippostrongylus brasiliensis]|uniref:Uncharacterized protein n=1 Tax=Nippostrongylus brasiliensis TaxID=27835 RepID=A0A0N4XLT8_NIPBR|nr:unnamed protein product [Nippostrongylus brasiliensis]
MGKGKGCSEGGFKEVKGGWEVGGSAAGKRGKILGTAIDLTTSFNADNKDSILDAEEDTMLLILVTLDGEGLIGDSGSEELAGVDEGDSGDRSPAPHLTELTMKGHKRTGVICRSVRDEV